MIQCFVQRPCWILGLDWGQLCGMYTVMYIWNGMRAVPSGNVLESDNFFNFRAAWGLWKDSLYEIQTVDTSREMGDMARHLRTGGRGEDERGEEGETISGVYFRQYLPTSNTVLMIPTIIVNFFDEIFFSVLG